MTPSLDLPRFAVLAAPLHVRAGREAAEERVRLRGAAAAAGGDGPRVEPEHAAGAAGPQAHAHRHRDQGERPWGGGR